MVAALRLSGGWTDALDVINALETKEADADVEVPATIASLWSKVTQR